jgi:hypothetical protein
MSLPDVEDEAVILLVLQRIELPLQTERAVVMAGTQ